LKNERNSRSCDFQAKRNDTQICLNHISGSSRAEISDDLATLQNALTI